MEALSKKYGPLPGSVWLLIVFIGVFFLIKSRQGAAGKKKEGNGPSSVAGGIVGDKNNPQNKYQTSSEYTGTFNMAPGTGGGTYEQKGGTYNQGAVDKSVGSNSNNKNAGNVHTTTKTQDARITVSNNQKSSKTTTTKKVTHNGKTIVNKKKTKKSKS